ncbi:long-chain acyl-CoA synthetase [Comamonas odontotermitis]|uniref:Long-chain acyl-CoA synthetase n=1 Tax=Comamonas odontotermitis TaxID=379895 RepID=A0ABR6RL18_9BURK|nr:long-chain fatty acid--CoA ligase [Comamonas odontotermitis]MBB6579880.1 long-chain acyl-CoA synthetase [Comamonas odontotermitis]
MTTSHGQMPDLRTIDTLPALFQYRCNTTPAREAYRWFDAPSNQWQSFSWSDMQQAVATWSQAIGNLQLERGARIATLLTHSVHAICIDQAGLAQGCVTVPLHANDNPGNIAFILADAGASLLLVNRLEAWQKIAATGTPLPALRCVVVDDPNQPAIETGASGADGAVALRVVRLQDWLQESGSADAVTESKPVQSAQPQDLAAIVYTSGTTGKPKGVMLSHRNVMSDVKAVLGRVVPTQDDVFLSFLPVSHTFERTCGYYLPMAVASTVVYARSVAQLAEDMLAIRPTILVSVPRIYERIYAKIQEKLAGAAFKRTLFAAACSKGWERHCEAHGLANKDAPQGGLARLLPWSFLQKRVAQPILDLFGGRLRIAVTGGAAIPPVVSHSFLGLGLQLVQGFGMTETSPVLTANSLEHNDPSTVGKPLAGMEVRIGENKELQARGPNVMVGYWNRPEDTQKAFTDDGWLKTGDQAEIIDGEVRIVGRIKEIIVTATGEKVPPGDIEQALCADPLFEQTMVVGEHQPFIACVAVVNREEWKQLAASHGLDPDNSVSLQAPAVRKAVLQRIENLCHGFAKYAVPRAVQLVTEPWTVDNGLMTPTLKLRRPQLMQKYAGEIAAMYAK